MHVRTEARHRLAAPDEHDPITSPSDAEEHLGARGLVADDGGKVGLELELHLVDLAHPGRRVPWAAVRRATDDVATLPGGSALTLEPGGQVELSTPPHPDLTGAVAGLRADSRALGEALAARGYGAAALGTDPARAVRRVNPHPRYAAMEQHFDARGCGPAARAMMSSTAALQVNLDAGPPAAWADRLALLHALTPVLVAVSSTSSHLAGRSGWHSMRQRTWSGIDPRRCAPVPVGEPRAAWAAYALGAPLMVLRDGDDLVPVTRELTMRDWLRDPGVIGRRPTRADLDYHLTTLFPPVRPRGYLEVRCLDALPARWWPALAALVVTLVDDPAAADAARAACAPVLGLATVAAREGLADPRLLRAARACTALAARHAPPDLREESDRLAELVASGRTPGDEVRRRIETHGPLRVLREEAEDHD